MQTKDYTNALLNFNTLVYNELTFKTKEDFNFVIDSFIDDDILDTIQTILSMMLPDSTVYPTTKIIDTIINENSLTITFITNWIPHVEIAGVIAKACKNPVYYRYRVESMVTDHVGEYLFKNNEKHNEKEGYEQECNLYVKEMSKDSLAIALYFKTYLAEDLSFTEIDNNYVEISYVGELDKSVSEFQHTTTLMEKFNSL